MLTPYTPSEAVQTALAYFDHLTEQGVIEGRAVEHTASRFGLRLEAVRAIIANRRIARGELSVNVPDTLPEDWS